MFHPVAVGFFVRSPGVDSPLLLSPDRRAGLAASTPVGVNAFKYPADYSKKKNPTAVAVTVGDKTSKVAGIFQQQAKAVAGAVAAARPDLTVSALAKLSSVQKGLRVAAKAQ